MRLVLLLLLMGCGNRPAARPRRDSGAQAAPRRAVDASAPPESEPRVDAGRQAGDPPDAALPDAGPDGDAGHGEAAESDAGVALHPEVEGDPARFPLHAMATSLETSIYPTPRAAGDRIGYLRMGSRVRVGPRILGGGCSSGWHELASSGFVCARDGLEVRSSPVVRPSAPPPPCMTCPLPYPYGFTRLAHTPMLSRLPDLEETRAIDEIIAERERPPRPAAPPAETDGGGGAPDGGAAIENIAEAEAGEAPPTTAEARTAPSVLRWLERGFFVSINRLIGAKNRRLYFKTIYGRYVPENRVFRFAGYSPFAGERVGPDGRIALPIHYVKSTRAFLEPPAGGAERVRVDRLTRLDVTGRQGRSYRLASGQLVQRDWVARIEAALPPADLLPGEKWIDVDLSEQTLVAYEGDRAVLATMVSTGKEGFLTPRGDFRIRSKHVATTMDGNTATDGPYSIEDVPWTMYFHRSYALHGAFWHRQYGIARSHGCVNLSPNDARFLFDWTLPALPAGWHGVHATREQRGTRVIVHE